MPQSILAFETENLPSFQVGVPASFQIVVSGGTPSYGFLITQGTLPRSLSLNRKGKISGTPRRPADTTIFVKVTDKEGATTTQAFAVRVDNP